MSNKESFICDLTCSKLRGSKVTGNSLFYPYGKTYFKLSVSRIAAVATGDFGKEFTMTIKSK
jgi:hypothetical protein